MTGDIFLTGSTGFVGMELLARALERTDRSVSVLVRAGDDDLARTRVDGLLREMFGERAPEFAGRVRPLAGDVTSPGLGLAARVVDEVAERTTTIVHSAASVSFTLGLGEARAVNVGGTRHVLALAQLAARRGGLDCYGHISTAYVAGDHTGRFAETDHDLGQGFRNTYERSKFEAESLVREAGLPAKILRPSIIVGDRLTGWTAAFNVLYWPLQALSRGMFTAIPADPASPVDAVSVDYVADAVHALTVAGAGKTGAVGEPARAGAAETFHLVAGSRSVTLGELCTAACRYFGRPVPAVLAPEEFARLPPAGVAEQSALETGRIYFPYFTIGSRFSDGPTRARLEPAGIGVTPLPEYLERLLDFATRAAWGKRPIARAQARAAIAA